MKIALVHDYLNQFGGGERVLLSLMKQFPDAPVYTLLYDKEKTHGLFEGRVQKTSFLDFPFARSHHRLFIPLMPAAARSISLGSEYDLIISDSHGFSKGISYDRTKTKHISYIHTPLRYAWETDSYFLTSPLIRFFGAPIFAYLRQWDYRAAQQPDLLLANSSNIAAKIKRYYNRDSVILYPPVPPFLKEVSRARDGGFRNPSPAAPVLPLEKGEYYLALGRLLEYKRFDLIVEAFNELKLPLKIVGAGRLSSSLRAQARQFKIEFLPFQPEEKLRELYSNAKAFIMANDEDFGLVMAEAQSCGTPVIAYGKGGALEIVQDCHSRGGGNPDTGILFPDQTVDSLVSAINRFEAMTFDRSIISKTAERFSEENFQKGIQQTIDRLFTT